MIRLSWILPNSHKIFQAFVRSLLSCVLGTLFFVGGRNIAIAQEEDTIWQRLKPYFNPPPKYEGDFGKYRTPLKFYDGRLVKTLADWKRRRKEIIDQWQQMMGPWPEMVTKPAVEIIDTTPAKILYNTISGLPGDRMRKQKGIFWFQLVKGKSRLL